MKSELIHLVYTKALKPIFFLQDPEDVHDRMTKTGQFLGKFTLTQIITDGLFNYQNETLEQEILGIKFKNPIGLSAGFDKDALLTDILPHVGFGFEEVGSITGEKCLGNPRPRLWRLKKSKGLVVYYGLKNDGCEIISERLKTKEFKFPVGISIAKTNCKETVDIDTGIADYIKAFSKFIEIGDYFTINISCPNAYGGEPFTNPQYLEKLLTQIDKIITHSELRGEPLYPELVEGVEPFHKHKPIFIKLAADLTHKQIDDILNVIKNHKIDGIICTNLTKDRNNKKIIDNDVPEKGGMSGKVVEDITNEMIKYIYQETKGKYIIIGCGGVFSAQDAYKKIKLGASLIQMITGMIFEGPQVIGEINRGLSELVKKDGYTNVSQAIGADNKF